MAQLPFGSCVEIEMIAELSYARGEEAQRAPLLNY
jgi:hypothetical protein